MKTKSRKRRVPVTDRPRLTSSSSNHSSGSLIRKFHVLLKRKAQLQHQQDAQTLAEVEKGIEALGGLSAYQRMSSIGQGNDRGGGSHKVLISWLKEMGMAREGEKIRLLEVGALKPDNYGSCLAWIDCTPIDLCSRHPSIQEQDFLLMDKGEHCGRWDLISLSLVLNFVPDRKARGRMLLLAHDMLSPAGLLFLALPLSCVLNSRYLTLEHLRALLKHVGFAEVNERWKKGGKMAYWLFRKVEKGDTGGEFRKKVVIKQGNRNNFCILL